MKKILVIGASGFVGKHVTKALLAEGHAVRCLARNLAKVEELAAAGCEITKGPIALACQCAAPWLKMSYLQATARFGQNG